MRVRMAFAGLSSILNLKLVHKHGDLKVFLLPVLVSLDIACPILAIFLSVVAISVIMAAIAIVQEEFSEKIDEGTSQGDP